MGSDFPWWYPDRPMPIVAQKLAIDPAVVRRVLTRAAAVVAVALTVGCAGNAAKYPEVSSRDGEVVVEMAGVAPGTGRFYSYRTAAGVRLDFFVYRDSAAKPHAVLDACKECYRWKKGYRLDGEEVVCVKCGMRFTLDGLERGTGSCVPIALAAVERGESLVIPAASLEAGARYF